MAIATQDLEVEFSAVTEDEIRQDQIWNSITTQDWTEPWVQGAASVRIPKPTFDFTAGTNAGTVDDPGDSVGVRSTTRARAGDWAPLSGIGSSRLVFQRTGGRASSQFMGDDDIIESPWDVVEAYRSRASYEIRNDLDSDIMTALRGYPNATTAFGDGSAGEMIDAMGNPGTDAAKSNALVYAAIEAWADLVQERDLTSEASDDVGGIYLLMHTRLWKALRRHMLAEKYSWDELTADLLRSNTALAAMGYRGRLLGVDVITTNKYPVPSSGSAASRAWTLTGGTRRAVAANVRTPKTQYFTTSQNQITDEPGNVLRQAVDYGVLELNGSEMMQSFTIDAHATD